MTGIHVQHVGAAALTQECGSTTRRTHVRNMQSDASRCSLTFFMIFASSATSFLVCSRYLHDDKHIALWCSGSLHGWQCTEAVFLRAAWHGMAWESCQRILAPACLARVHLSCPAPRQHLQRQLLMP